MKRILFLCSLFLVAQASFAQPAIYNADRLMQRVSNPDTLYVVNFWATWCGPCVAELPEFNKLQAMYAGKPVKIILASLDFKEAYPRKLEAFANRKKLQQEIVWFNETDANKFIPKIDNRWQGSIPATLLIAGKNEYKNFFEGSITAKQLSTLIDKQLALQ